MSVINLEQESMGEDHWISVSDLMSALMMIFLLLSLMYMIQIDRSQKTIVSERDSAKLLIEEKAKLVADYTGRLEELHLSNSAKDKQIQTLVAGAVVYDDVIKELHQSLLGEFNSDLKKWNAELREDLTFRFNEPTTLFSTGAVKLKPKFKAMLDDFFPRYLAVITAPKFRADIAEIRIEGHTSSLWGNLPKDSQDAYFYNMTLSQVRSRNTLFYVMSQKDAVNNKQWLKNKLTANGLSSSKPVDEAGFLLTHEMSNGVEDQLKSQRVEFRVRIDAESKISSMLNESDL